MAVSVPVRWLARPTPVTSSGLCAVAKDGRCGVILSAVSVANGGMEMPWSLDRSAMMSQAPPEAVMTPIRRPAGTRS